MLLKFFVLLKLFCTTPVCYATPGGYVTQAFLCYSGFWYSGFCATFVNPQICTPLNGEMICAHRFSVTNYNHSPVGCNWPLHLGRIRHVTGPTWKWRELSKDSLCEPVPYTNETPGTSAHLPRLHLKYAHRYLYNYEHPVSFSFPSPPFFPPTTHCPLIQFYFPPFFLHRLHLAPYYSSFHSPSPSL